MTGQRGVTALLYLLLLVAGALLGHPGQLPAGLDGQTITPEFILQLVAPIGLLFTTITGVFQGISARVETGQIASGDLLALGSLSEFWVGLVSVLVFVIHTFFKVDFLTPDQQAVVANGLLAVFTALLNSFGQRSPGQALTNAQAVRVKYPLRE
jgi:hypothetical protein